jgi:hypothetical protein
MRRGVTSPARMLLPAGCALYHDLTARSDRVEFDRVRAQRGLH